MGKDCGRSIKLIELASPLMRNGWITRGDLYALFIDTFGFSESKFNSLLFLLKAKKIISEHNYTNGYHIDSDAFEKFKKKWKTKPGGKA